MVELYTDGGGSASVYLVRIFCTSGPSIEYIFLGAWSLVGGSPRWAFWGRESMSLENWRKRVRRRWETTGEKLAVDWERKPAMRPC